MLRNSVFITFFDPYISKNISVSLFVIVLFHLRKINSKYMHELIVLAHSAPFPLKLCMSEVFPGPRTNYSEPSAVPGAKVIM